MQRDPPREYIPFARAEESGQEKNQKSVFSQGSSSNFERAILASSADQQKSSQSQYDWRKLWTPPFHKFAPTASISELADLIFRQTKNTLREGSEEQKLTQSQVRLISSRIGQSSKGSNNKSKQRFQELLLQKSQRKPFLNSLEKRYYNKQNTLKAVESSSSEDQEQNQEEAPQKLEIDILEKNGEFDLTPSILPDRVTSRCTLLGSEDMGLLSAREGESLYTARSDQREGYLTVENQHVMMTQAELEGCTHRNLSNENAIFSVYQECIKAARGQSSEKKELLKRRVLQREDFPSQGKQESSLHSSRPPYYPKIDIPGEKLIKHIRKASTTTTRGEEQKSNLTFALDGQEEIDENSSRSVNSFDSSVQQNYTTPPESVLTPPPPPPLIQDVFNRETVRRGSEQVSQIFKVVESYLKKLNPSVRSHPDTESLLSLISCHNNGGLPEPPRAREQILIEHTPTTPAPLTPSSLQHSRTKRAQPLSPVLIQRSMHHSNEQEAPIFTPRRHTTRAENSTPCQGRERRMEVRSQRINSTPINQNELIHCQERVDSSKLALMQSLTRRTKNNIKAYKRLMKQEKKSKTELKQRISALENLVQQMQQPQLPPIVAFQSNQIWKKLFGTRDSNETENLSPSELNKQNTAQTTEQRQTHRSLKESTGMSQHNQSSELQKINDRLAQQLEANLQTFSELNSALTQRQQSLLEKDSALHQKDAEILKLKKQTERMAAQIQKLCALGKALGFCKEEKYEMPLRMEPSQSSSPSPPTQSFKDLSMHISTVGSNVIPHPRRVEDVSRSSHSPFFKSSTSPFFRSKVTEEVRDSSLVMQMLASPGQSVNTCSGSQMIADFMRSIRQMQRANHSHSCLSSLRLSESAALSQRLARENSLSQRNNQITQN